MVDKRPTERWSFIKNSCPVVGLTSAVVFVEKWALTWSAGQDAKEVFRGHWFRDLKWAWKSRFQVIRQQFLRTLLVECVWKPFLLEKSMSYLTGTVGVLPAEVLRKFYSAVWGWRREVLFTVTSSNTSARTAIQSKLAFVAWSTSSDKELKVSNLLLHAISSNKAYGKSLAATEHKDTISDEDKQRLGNFVLCLRNARFDIVCFGSMAKEAQVELCVVFNWHQGDFCKFSWKTCFEPVLASLCDEY